MASMEDNTVYMTLNTRGVPGTFHWGVFITTSAPKGHHYHATNKAGGWQLEARISENALSSLSLVLVYKIGTLSSQASFDQVLRAIPATGSASLRTGEAFTCRIWMKDALMALQSNQVVTLSADIDTLEKKAFDRATRLERGVELGKSRATIMNSASST